MSLKQCNLLFSSRTTQLSGTAWTTKAYICTLNLLKTRKLGRVRCSDWFGTLRAYQKAYTNLRPKHSDNAQSSLLQPNDIAQRHGLDAQSLWMHAETNKNQKPRPCPLQRLVRHAAGHTLNLTQTETQTQGQRTETTST